MLVVFYIVATELSFYSGFTISISPKIGILTVGDTMQTSVKVSSDKNGYPYAVSLVAASQHSGMETSFNPQSGLTSTSASIMTIKVNSTLPDGNYSINVKGIGADGYESEYNYYNITLCRNCKK